MRKFWCLLFALVPIAACWASWISPEHGWWFPGPSVTKLGEEIDNLFYLLMIVVTVVFIAVNIALAYTLYRASHNQEERAWFTHGSHNLEVTWSVATSVILVFLSLYQLDVWQRFRVKTFFPDELKTSTADGSEIIIALKAPIAEVTARQFEWRIRYPAPGKELDLKPQPDDLYTVNDLHAPIGRAVMINLRSDDVQHSFFLPHLRIKQDAVPGQVIPIWFQVEKQGTFDLACAELCGWGHYKMRGQLVAEREIEFQSYLKKLQADQNYDGHATPSAVAKKDE